MLARGHRSDEVMAPFDVLDEAGVGSLPAQEFLGDGARSRHVGAEDVREHAAEIFGGEGPSRQVQVPTDGLGDLADGYAFVADSVEHGAGGSLLDREPVKTRGVLHVDGGPAAGPVADVAGDALGPGKGDELGMKP